MVTPLKQSALIARIDQTRLNAGFSISDMSRWLGAPVGTVRTWCRGERYPKDHKRLQIEERLGWLSDILLGSHDLPIPLTCTQSQRISYIATLRARYEQRAQGQ